MLTKSILTAAAISLAAFVGSASAGEQFSTLDAISADVMSPAEMSAVQGKTNNYLVMVVIPTRRAYEASMLYQDDLGAAMVMVRIAEYNGMSQILVELHPPGLNGR